MHWLAACANGEKTKPVKTHVAKTTGPFSGRPHARRTAPEHVREHGKCEEISRVHGPCVRPGNTGRFNG